MIVNIKEFKIFIGSDSADEELLELFLLASERQAERYCNRCFEDGEYTDFHRDAEGNIVLAGQYPVLEILEISVGLTMKNISEYHLISNSSGEMDRLKGRFGPEVFIRYRAGYDGKYPADLKLAIMILARHYFTKHDRNLFSVSSESDGNTSSNTIGMPEEVANLLASHRRLV